MPGRKWYAVAALVFFLGMALFGVFLFTRLRDFADGLQQVVVPGEAELVLQTPGSYTIFHEHESVVGGRYYSSPEEVPGLEVQVVSSETGEVVPLRAPKARTSYSLGGRSGVSIFTFEIGEPGPYRVSAGFPGGRQGQELVLAVGQGFGRKLVLTILGALAIGLASFILAISIAVVTFWKRRKALRATAGPQPKPA